VFSSASLLEKSVQLF